MERGCPGLCVCVCKRRRFWPGGSAVTRRRRTRLIDSVLQPNLASRLQRATTVGASWPNPAVARTTHCCLGRDLATACLVPLLEAATAGSGRLARTCCMVTLFQTRWIDFAGVLAVRLTL